MREPIKMTVESALGTSNCSTNLHSFKDSPSAAVVNRKPSCTTYFPHFFLLPLKADIARVSPDKRWRIWSSLITSFNYSWCLVEEFAICENRTAKQLCWWGQLHGAHVGQGATLSSGRNRAKRGKSQVRIELRWRFEKWQACHRRGQWGGAEPHCCDKRNVFVTEKAVMF